MNRHLDVAASQKLRACLMLPLAFVTLAFVSGCQQKTVSQEEGKKMMDSFKGGPETAADRADDEKARQAALQYRKDHPEQFPTPKYNVPPGGKPEPVPGATQ